MKHVMGIESSCDETAVSIVRSDRTILSNIVLSQIDTHQMFGGVVPEIAARAHLDHIDTLTTMALSEAKVTWNNIDAFAATCGPGLIGGVIVGMMTAKSYAITNKKPFIAINHLEGHALTPRLTDDIKFPYLLLLISGGHTEILVCEDVGTYKQWGKTLDDAAGECFDKSAKLMGLPYPGGPHLEKIAAKCNHPEEAIKKYPLPRPLHDRKNLDFSFSGLKTAIRAHVDALPCGDLNTNDVADIAYSLHVATSEIFENRLNSAVQKFKKDYNITAPSVVLSGGVAANQFIGQHLMHALKKHNATVYTPPLNLSGDNAAMIAWAGIERLKHGQSNSFDFKAKPRWPLDPAT